MHILAIAALFAVTSFPISMPRIAAPIAGSRPTASAQAQSQAPNSYRPSFRQQPQEPSTFRLRAFFGSDVAKPLETVYFARPGSPCAGVPFYGFVFVTR